MRNVLEATQKPRAVRRVDLKKGETLNYLTQPPCQILRLVLKPKNAFSRSGNEAIGEKEKRLMLRKQRAPRAFYSSPYFLACHEGSGSKFLDFAFNQITGEVASDTLAPLDGSVALPKTHHRSVPQVSAVVKVNMLAFISTHHSRLG